MENTQAQQELEDSYKFALNILIERIEEAERERDRAVTENEYLREKIEDMKIKMGNK